MVQELPMHDTTDLIRALQLVRADRGTEALEVLGAVLTRTPDEPDALHLAGMALRSLGRLAEAEQYLRQSLESAPARAHVHNNLGNLLSQQQRHTEAVECYRRAIAIAPTYADAWHNLGAVSLRMGDASAACAALERATASEPGMARAWAALGHAHRELGRRDQARAAYRKSLQADPRRRGAHHGLALLLREEGELPGALQHIDRCIAMAPSDPEAHLTRGNILVGLARREDAIDAYRRAVELRPDHLEAHRALNNAIWLYGDAAQYLESFRRAFDRAPAAVDLHADFALRLILLGRAPQAQHHLSKYMARGVESASMHHALGRALANMGRTAQAHQSLHRAVALDPAPRFRLDAARLCLIERDACAALSHLEAALDAAPDDQVAIAYRGVCWRDLGDPREAALNDYSRYVRTFDLPAPAGYASIGDFNRELALALTGLHSAQRAPVGQSLRGGTQTVEDLFATDLPLIRALRAQLEAAVREYVHDLPADADHPLLRRKREGFRFAGSWSVRLTRSGYHVNHVHSQGWISSCYYVRVPRASADATAQAGWLRLGETDLNLADRERIGRMIQPREGMLALFPSYLFHGTTPFDADEERITVAFDVIPA